MNLNKLARTIALKEKGKKEVSIAQIKEVLKITLHELAKEPLYEIAKLLKRY
jgi:hypothetical protein